MKGRRMAASMSESTARYGSDLTEPGARAASRPSWTISDADLERTSTAQPDARCSRPSSSAAPRELGQKRSGYEQPVLVAFGPGRRRADRRRARPRRRCAPTPLRSTSAPGCWSPRSSARSSRRRGAGQLRAGAPRRSARARRPRRRDAELVPLAFEAQLEGVDRLRARALAVPGRPAEAGPARADRRRPPLRVAAASRPSAAAPPTPPRSRSTRTPLAAARRGPPARRARTTTPIRPGASPAASCSGSTAWGSGAGTTRSSPIWRAGSPATTAPSPRPWARG